MFYLFINFLSLIFISFPTHKPNHPFFICWHLCFKLFIQPLPSIYILYILSSIYFFFDSSIYVFLRSYIPSCIHLLLFIYLIHLFSHTSIHTSLSSPQDYRQSFPCSTLMAMDLLLWMRFFLHSVLIYNFFVIIFFQFYLFIK